MVCVYADFLLTRAFFVTVSLSVEAPFLELLFHGARYENEVLPS